MEKLIEFYQALGVSPAVYAYGERAIENLKEHSNVEFAMVFLKELRPMLQQMV